MERLFSVGDIHGQADKLRVLLTRLENLDPEARFVFLGDYVNRGPKTREVIDILLELRQRRPDSLFLLGNHEAALLHYAQSCDPEELRGFRGMGGQATLDSYGGSCGPGAGFLPAKHQAFFRGLKRWARISSYVFCHAPVPFGIDLTCVNELDLERLLSNRTIDPAGWETSGLTLVFGHTSLDTPLVAPGLIGLDTGASYGGPLTAVELPEVRFHHV